LTIIWLIDWEAGSYQVTFPATTYEITSCGSQKSVIKSQTGHPLVHGLWQRYDRFSSMLIEQGF
jgi:hypothetical protein